MSNNIVWMIIVCCSMALQPAFPQGLVNFVNDPSTLVSVGPPGVGTVMSGPPGSYYFALLTSAVGGNNFTFAGIYATNESFAGLLTGGTGVVVSGWAPGTARDFMVVGWSGSLGSTFNPAWLTPGTSNLPGYFGESAIGSGLAGGSTSSGTVPNLNIFGGPAGIQNGFYLTPPVIPEPSGMALAGLAITALVSFRRKWLTACTDPIDGGS